MTRESTTYPWIPEEFKEDDERTPLTPGFQKSSSKMMRQDATYPWVPEEFTEDDERGRRHVETSVRGGDR